LEICDLLRSQVANAPSTVRVILFCLIVNLHYVVSISVLLSLTIHFLMILKFLKAVSPFFWCYTECIRPK